ncbi:MAG: CopD family protein [Gemmatimonadetes bacterium]|nr:CopD family protein [Gemmatimonadota bacterium]
MRLAEGERRWGWRRSALAAALALVAGAATATAADAAPSPDDASRTAPRFHTELEAAYPAADTVHTHEIEEVRLRYTTAVQPSLSTITVRGSGGVLAGVADPETVPGSGGREIRAALERPLPSGSYTVEWRTAGPDGHPIRGSYGFRVDRPATSDTLDTVPAPAPAPVAVEETEDGPERSAATAPLGLSVRWLFFTAVIGMVGVPAFRLAVAGATAGGERLGGILAPAARRSRTLAWAVGGLALALVPVRLVLQATALFGADAWRPTRLGALLESTWGAGWALHLGLASLFLLGVAWPGAGGARARGWWVAASAGMGMPLAVALSGHAAAAGPTVLAVLNDGVHVAAAGLWAGTLACVLLVGIPALREGVESEEDGILPGLDVLVAAFSRLAVVAVGMLVLSGLVSAWLQVGGIGALFGTSYGRTLLLKLALVVPAVALGFYNWRVVRPAIKGRPRVGLFRLPASVEVLLALAVLMVTAVLVALPRPGGP